MHFDNQITADAPSHLLTLEARLGDLLTDQSIRPDIRFLRSSPEHASNHAEGVTKQDTLTVRITPTHVHLALLSGTSVHTPCTECLERRLFSMSTPDEQWALQSGSVWEGGDSAEYLALVMEHACLIARHLLERRNSTDRQTVLTIDLLSQAIRSDELLRDSFCHRCASNTFPTEETAVIPLRSSLPARSGKSRMKGLLEYELPSRALVNPVCGAVAGGLSVGYVQCVTAPVFSGYVQRAFNDKPRIVGWSGLCTRTDESRIAGMLEALERQAGMLAHPASIAAVGSYRSLSDRAMDPRACFAYNKEAYELPLGLTPFDIDLSIEWVWGYSLMSERALLVPKQLVFYDRINASRRLKLVDNNSSGCALGSCYEEAIQKALLELIERDSFVIAWHRMLSLPKIALHSCTDFRSACLLDRIHHLKYDVSLLDARLDMRTPSVIAVARRRDRGIGAMAVGASASTAPDDAVRGALLECTTAIAEMPGMFEQRETHVRQLAEDYRRVESVMDHSLLYALPEMADKVRWFDGSDKIHTYDETYGADADWFSRGDIAQDLGKILDDLKRCGITEAAVVDLTTQEQREFDLKTVRVIVPGLAPIDFGFPRNRAGTLPRLWSAPSVGPMAVDNTAGLENLNGLPHPFP